MTTTLTSESTSRRVDWRNQITAYLFLLPALLVFAVASWYPILNTIRYSFHKVNLTGVHEAVGFANYERMLGNPVFYQAWENSLVFVILSLIMGAAVPIILALIINEMRKLSTLFSTIIYLPTLIPIAVGLIVWRQIYHPEGGALNSLLRIFDIPPQLWLQNPLLAKPALIIIMTWVGAGGSTLLYLAALREIPSEIFEAAELDGFSVLHRIRHIALPLLRKRILIMLVLQVIVVAQVFTEPFILTNGGPANSTTTPVLEIYNAAFTRTDFGLASAWGVSMLVALSLFSILYVLYSREDISRG